MDRYINRIHTFESDKAIDSPATDGAYKLELKNVDSSIIQSYSFDLLSPDSWHGKSKTADSFRFNVMALADLHTIHITGPGGANVTATASANKPVLTANVSINKDDGLRTLHWSATDDDGDTLFASIYLKGDDGAWHGVAANLADSKLKLNENNLPAAKSVSARIIISDGFHSTSTELEIGAGAPLRVLTVTPHSGAQEVDVMTEISVWITNPLVEKHLSLEPVALPSGKITLSDSTGQIVNASARYSNGERIITLTPAQPLEPATKYQVSLQGLTDRWKNELDRSYSWSFQTGPYEEDPEAEPELDEPPIDDNIDAPGRQASKENSMEANNTKADTSSSNAVSTMDFPTMDNSSSSEECTCECHQRASADELCALLCEDEFVACGKP